ncbi:uncharacterized protein LOC123715080 [Pieris brassicae]|uniref:uncharacterized protein LOC123715080 n=1 Tax=Pieris brassicae TaxID=7116 RepID=UPI001E65F1CE|nr:uncharacterized protein LOC123715080 [Pieris brassicae]
MNKEDEEKSRPPSSRRNSVSLSRRSSVDKTVHSTNSTPKKTQKFDFVVTGKQILKKSDRAQSLPGGLRRQSADSLRKKIDSPKRIQTKSRDASLDDDMSLDLSQVSDFEDTNSKYGAKKFTTSTPKKVHKRLIQSVLTDKHNKSLESRSKESSFSRDSKSSLAYSVSTWQESEPKPTGEWSNFWANYNNSLARVPISRYYDQCPTPYRTEDFDLTDFDLSNEGLKRSPDDITNINYIIRNEGLHLTPRETQNIIKCTHILGNVLTKAIERQSKESQKEYPEPIIDLEKDLKKKSMSLNLKETVLPLEVKEEKTWESVPTQTDISLPNTKSAPKIFEKILRQLSKSSLEEKVISETPEESQETKNEEVKETN